MNNSIKYNESLNAIISYCDYRERCSSEVRAKLREFDLDETTRDSLFNEIKELKVFDDARFIEAFIGGKIRIKRWGKNKIKAALLAKKIEGSIIDEAFINTVDMDEYMNHLQHLFTRKWDQLKNNKDYATRQKIFRYLYGKGYESNLISEILRSNLDD